MWDTISQCVAKELSDASMALGGVYRRKIVVDGRSFGMVDISIGRRIEQLSNTSDLSISPRFSKKESKIDARCLTSPGTYLPPARLYARAINRTIILDRSTIELVSH